MTEQYKAGHGDDAVVYRKVKADLTLLMAVRFSRSFPAFFQTTPNKKGPTFR
jgi:hypothetical protein